MNRYELFKAGIDVTEGMKRFNNEKETYGAFLLKFMEDEYYSELCSALAEGDIGRAFNAAHSLKGVAGNLSLTDLHESLLPLVEELRHGSLKNSGELLAPITAAYEAIQNILKKNEGI